MTASDQDPVFDADRQAALATLSLVLGYEPVTDDSGPATSTASFRTSVVDDIHDGQLRADWAELEAGGHASVFQTYGWQFGLVTHLRNWLAIKPLFVTIRDAATGQPVAIFPLQIRRWHGCRMIAFLGTDFCDTNMPLMAAGFAPTGAGAQRLIDALIAALPAADLIRLAKMPEDFFGRANPFAGISGRRASPDQTFPVELDSSAEGFVQSKSAYKTYQKQWRKLSRREGIAVEMIEGTEAIGKAFDAMIAMRQSRFTDLNRDDLLNDTEVSAFYRAMALLPEGERTARIAALKVGDIYSAYIYMLVRDGKFSTVISAMDNTVGNAYAPGLILFTKIFEQASEAGFRFGDIGIGYMHYKTRFAARQNPLFVWEKALTLKGTLVLAGLDMLRTAKTIARENKLIRAVAEKVLKRKIGAPAAAQKVETVEED